jgi:hypothetical protein
MALFPYAGLPAGKGRAFKERGFSLLLPVGEPRFGIVEVAKLAACLARLAAGYRIRRG